MCLKRNALARSVTPKGLEDQKTQESRVRFHPWPFPTLTHAISILFILSSMWLRILGSCSCVSEECDWGRSSPIKADRRNQDELVSEWWKENIIKKERNSSWSEADCPIMAWVCGASGKWTGTYIAPFYSIVTPQRIFLYKSQSHTHIHAVLLSIPKHFYLKFRDTLQWIGELRGILPKDTSTHTTVE